jgi:hypothetical protein
MKKPSLTTPGVYLSATYASAKANWGLKMTTVEYTIGNRHNQISMAGEKCKANLESPNQSQQP